HHFSYICVGEAPASASQIRLTGYSTFLREEWLAVFHVDEKAFQTMAGLAELAPADEFEFRDALERSSLEKTKLFKNVPVSGNLQCFKRVFKKTEEHESGTIFALFDPATSTAVVLRERSD
ncbi:MAG TPA: hypothetical protein VFY06_05850, partial [Verrucomicrobiae bacterium]|nr:hypothetical protein [Verrucomicrobiae bacterium]